MKPSAVPPVIAPHPLCIRIQTGSDSDTKGTGGESLAGRDIIAPVSYPVAVGVTFCRGSGVCLYMWNVGEYEWASVTKLVLYLLFYCSIGLLTF